MVASLRQQYGLRVQSDEFASMGWDEFSDLVAGLNESTPLARVAQVRTESDPEALKKMTPEQRRMRAEWQRSRALARTQEDVTGFVSSMQKAFENMFGEVRDAG